MAYPQTNGTYDHHEERIQRLEESSKEIAVKISAQSEQVKVLSQKIDDVGRQLTDKMDETIGHIAKHLEITSEKVDKSCESTAVVTLRVKELEEADQKRKARWSSIGKWVWAAVAGLAGIIATKVIEMLLK